MRRNKILQNLMLSIRTSPYVCCLLLGYRELGQEFIQVRINRQIPLSLEAHQVFLGLPFLSLAGSVDKHISHLDMILEASLTKLYP